MEELDSEELDNLSYVDIVKLKSKDKKQKKKLKRIKDALSGQLKS